MGKLTHIADIEKREKGLADEQEMLEAQKRLANNTVRHKLEQRDESKPEDLSARSDAREQQVPQSSSTKTHVKDETYERSAVEELKFHGLDDKDSMGIGQLVLIAAAVVVFVVAVVYVANNILHFL